MDGLHMLMQCRGASHQIALVVTVLSAMSLPRAITMLTLVAGVLGSQPECSMDNAEALKGLSQDTNKFGWDLFKEVVKDSTVDNVFLSAPSISAAFGMLYLGAKGDSSKEIKQTLFPEVADNSVASGYLSLLSKLKPSSGQFQLSLANGAFIEQSAHLLDAYINTVKKCFSSEVRAMDFQRNPDAERVTINTWVSNKTQERIKDLLPDGSITSTTALVLANAIYFKSQWLRTFSKDSTRNMTFFGMNNEETRTEMMKMQFGSSPDPKQPKFSFYEDRQKKIQMIELPYTGEEVSMMILLPEDPQIFRKIEKDLSGDFIKDVQSKMRPTALSRIMLPKWKVTRELDLIKLMKSLNMTSVFDQSRADLSGITGARNLYVSGAFHKAFVEVNEEGTEAAAATAVVATFRSAARRKPQFVANKPFIYMIWHKATKMALFIGRYVTPN